MKLALKLSLLACAAVFASCTKKGGQENVEVEQVILDKENIEIAVGGTMVLSYEILPENATDKTVEWLSDDASVVTVVDGTITAVGEGTAKVTVRSVSAQVSDALDVTVIAQTVGVTGISLNKETLTLKIGDSERLVCTVSPEDATNTNVSWSSSDEAVAVVDAEGTVTALQPGECNINVVSEDGGHKATCAVSVEAASSSDDYIDEYGVNHGKGIEVGGVVWAPVNCGWHKDDFQYGKLYQWGRKDGQGYQDDEDTELKDGILPDIKSGQPASLDAAEPNVFYTGWDTDIAPHFTWGSVDGTTKTKYDPCPEGWRVPTYEEFLSLVYIEEGEIVTKNVKIEEFNGQKGAWFSGQIPINEAGDNKVFLPCSGYRYVDTYALGRLTRGRYWTTTPSDEVSYTCIALYFFDGQAYYDSDEFKGDGYSIRCVKE